MLKVFLASNATTEPRREDRAGYRALSVIARSHSVYGRRSNPAPQLPSRHRPPASNPHLMRHPHRRHDEEVPPSLELVPRRLVIDASASNTIGSTVQSPAQITSCPSARRSTAAAGDMQLSKEQSQD